MVVRRSGGRPWTAASDRIAWELVFRDDTVVIFTSDHGDNLGEHMLVHKQSLYEASVKVPMVRPGGQWDAVGVDTEHLVSGLDVVPTVCVARRKNR